MSIPGGQLEIVFTLDNTTAQLAHDSHNFQPHNELNSWCSHKCTNCPLYCNFTSNDMPRQSTLCTTNTYELREPKLTTRYHGKPPTCNEMLIKSILE